VLDRDTVEGAKSEERNPHGPSLFALRKRLRSEDMALKLHELKAREKEIAVAFGDDSVRVRYRPYAITPESEARIANSTGAETMLATFCEIVAGWDLLDDDGAPLPITLETLRQVPSQALAEIIRATTEDERPKKEPTASSSFS
jgi:hypothetical protein